LGASFSVDAAVCLIALQIITVWPCCNEGIKELVLLIRSVTRKLGFLLIIVKAISIGGLCLWDCCQLYHLDKFTFPCVRGDRTVQMMGGKESEA
jgi:hypothetical protein